MLLVFQVVVTCLTTNLTMAPVLGKLQSCQDHPDLNNMKYMSYILCFRCWVAGWGKDAEDGNFQFIQHKVDVPLYDQDRCERRLKQELGRQDSRSGRDFFLTPGELCAGGEQGKDACDGDGGAPLVCKSNSGHWHVVGLVAWGVGCANPDVPGVYVNVAHYLDFITANHRRG